MKVVDPKAQTNWTFVLFVVVAGVAAAYWILTRGQLA